jgi:hypothetical protein
MPIRRLSSKLRRHGWALFPAAVSNDLVAAATHAIQADLAQNYEPDRQREYDNISFCPDLRDKTPIAELLTHSSAKAIVDRALSWNEIEYYHGQIAIRQAHTLTSLIRRRRISTALPPAPSGSGNLLNCRGAGPALTFDPLWPSLNFAVANLFPRAVAHAYVVFRNGVPPVEQRGSRHVLS